MNKALQPNGPSIVGVTADDVGRRLDNFLLSRLKGVPRSRVYRMIRSGEVRVNGGRARPDKRVALDDQVRIPPLRQPQAQRPAGTPADKLTWLAERILYEDRDLLVLDKPAGLAVHGGSGVSWGAIELLRQARPQTPGLELVHRLDRETSGCLLVAKRRPALRNLHEQFREGSVRKHYQTLLCGRFKGKERLIDAPLLTHRRRGGERHVCVDEAGKTARSRFTPYKRYRALSLVDVLLETGRTHQIRVHAAHVGHPVAGDARYGSHDDVAQRRFGLQRLFLHAIALSFDSPRDGRLLRVDCPLDEELQGVLDRVGAAERP